MILKLKEEVLDRKEYEKILLEENDSYKKTIETLK